MQTSTTKPTILPIPLTGKRAARKKRPIRPPAIILISGLVVGFAVLLPLAYLLLRTATAGPKLWDILLRPRTWEIFFNSVALALTVAGFSAVIGLALAWLTIRTDLPGKKFFTVATILPLVIPSYLFAFTLVSTLGPKGLAQQWLEPLGVERLPKIYGFWGAVLALTLVSYPFVLLSVRAGLRGLDPALEEAARSLGRNPRAVFWEITLPHLKPSIMAGALLAALYALSDFGAVSMLQFSSFTQAIYIQYNAAFDRSVAAVLSLLLVIVALVLLSVEAKTRSRARYYRSSAGVIRPAQPIQLGKWRWPALIFTGFIVLPALVMPLGVISFWFIRGLLAGESIIITWQTVWNSVSASGLAALAAALAAIPVALLAVRYPGRWSCLVEKASYSGYALPGIVIALSLVFFGANYATFLYQTVALLVFAYVVRFLPQVIGTTRASLLQINPAVEEAARSLGRNPLTVLRTVTVPLLKSGLWTGAALVFLTAMKELPATLLLSPTGYSTLATRIWDATEEAFFARAAAPALLLLLVSGLSIMIILSKEEK